MILVDTSVWIDHLRQTDAQLSALLNIGGVLGHPFVTGELALGSLHNREMLLAALQGLPQAAMATDPEVMTFITSHALHGLGIGYVDVHLLAATKLTPTSRLWTRDRRLLAAAAKLNLAMVLSH